MAVYYPDACDEELPDHVCDPCEVLEGGRIRSVAYIKNTFTFDDPSNPVEWAAGIASGDIVMVPSTRGSFDGGSEVTGPGYGDQTERLVGYNFSAQIFDPNYKGNCNFYNILLRSRGHKFAYRTGSQIHIVDKTVQFIPKNPVQDDINSEVVWDVTVRWADSVLPCPYDTPPGIFDECVNIS